MAWPHPSSRAVVNLSEGLDAQFHVPANDTDDTASPLDWQLPSGEVIHSPRRGWMSSPEVSPPVDLWRNGGRERATFGTNAVEMSLGQAKLRKLVVWCGLFQGLIRTQSCNPRGEDRLMEVYAKRQAAKALAQATI
jgi:hypothetical protein